MDCKKLSGECRFRPLAGMRMVYEPGSTGREEPKKHPCADCHFCQQCSDVRCEACRCQRIGLEKRLDRKLSLREQSQLFQRINRVDGDEWSESNSDCKSVGIDSEPL